MAFKYSFGEPVAANLGNGMRVAWVIEDAYDVDGADGPETKYGIQGPNDAQVHPMAYTESVTDGKVPGGFFTRLDLV